LTLNEIIRFISGPYRPEPQKEELISDRMNRIRSELAGQYQGMGLKVSTILTLSG